MSKHSDHLCNPKPNLFDKVRWNVFGPDFVVDGMLSRPNIGFFWLDHLCSLEHLPEHIKDHEDRYVNVSNEKVLGIESWNESGKTIEDDDNGKVDKSKPASVWLEWSFEDQSVSIDILSYKCFSEVQISHTDGYPCEKLGNGDQVLEPIEDNLGSTSARKKCEKADNSCNGDSVNWNTLFGTLEEDGWGLSVLSDTEEITGSSVQESIGRGRGRSQNDGVDNTVESFDTRSLDGNNPWRSKGTWLSAGKIWILSGNQDTNGERAENVEEKNTPEDTTNGLWNVLERIFSFTSSNGNHFYTTV